MTLANFGYDKWIIDVAKSNVPGKLCFCPVMPDALGQEGVIYHVTFFGEHPPVKDALIIGFMVEDSITAFAEWQTMQRPYLTKLNIRKS